MENVPVASVSLPPHPGTQDTPSLAITKSGLLQSQ